MSADNLKLTLVLRLDTTNANQLRLEDKHRVRRNRPHSRRAISVLRLDCERALLTDTHAEQALVPTLDDLTLADMEAQRLATVVGGIELAAVLGESAAVVDLDLVACASKSALPSQVE